MSQVIFFEQNVQNSYHNVLLNLHQAIDVNKLFNKSLILNPQVQTQSNVFHMISYFDWFFFFLNLFYFIFFKVLELGIIFHSVIIGVDLGANQSVSTIRPLLVALSFHQFFEGVGLGGCIAQV